CFDSEARLTRTADFLLGSKSPPALVGRQKECASWTDFSKGCAVAREPRSFFEVSRAAGSLRCLITPLAPRPPTSTSSGGRSRGRGRSSLRLRAPAVLRAWRGRATFAGRSSLRAWLYKIATNACLDALDKRPRTPVSGEIPWLQP